MKLAITHLAFADDILVFCKGDHISIASIMSIMKKFSEYTGLQLNNSKTTLLAGNIEPNEVLLWPNNFSIQQESLPIRYLGLLLCTSRIRSKIVYWLLRKIWREWISRKQGCYLMQEDLNSLGLSYHHSVCNCWAPLSYPKLFFTKWMLFVINFCGRDQLWVERCIKLALTKCTKTRRLGGST